MDQTTNERKAKPSYAVDAPPTPIPERGIDRETAKHFGVRRFVFDDEVHVWCPRKDADGHTIAAKVRVIRPDKPDSFFVEGDIRNAVLFGQDLFPSHGKFITIVEGHEDAMAAYQMFGRRYPVVSVDSASSARSDCVRNFQYLNSFEGIVINFDTDQPKKMPDGSVRYPGQEAAQAVAALFPLGKVKILQLSKAKDANDYLKAGLSAQYVDEWWKASPYLPNGLKFGKDMWDDISTPPSFETVMYPWASANAMTYGLRKSEVVLLTADTGIGKTSIAKEIEYHILKNSDHSVGILHLEEPNRDTAIGLMSIEANKPLHLPDVAAETSKEELRSYFDGVVNSDRVVMWDHFGSNNVDEVLNKIRHMRNLGCGFIFIDHLSIIVSDQKDDERKQLDSISTKLKTLCMELNIGVLAIIHLNRQGQVRGSAGPEQLANICIKAQRDKEDPDPWRRNVMRLTCTKNRFCGRTGPMTYLYYEPETGRLRELTKDEVLKYEQGESTEVKEQWN